MGIFDVVLLAVGVAMDACAVAICRGVCLKDGFSLKQGITVGIWFGSFQAAMPIIGFFIGSLFFTYITEYAHMIAFVLLAYLGIEMLLEHEENINNGSGIRFMLGLSVATSIDALVGGVTLAAAGANIWICAVIIGLITFALSVLGVKLGAYAGVKFKTPAVKSGGIILICLAFKILIENFI